MVSLNQIEYYGNLVNQVVVDNSDSKHTNRVLRLTETKIPGIDYHKYSVSVDWSKGQYAADMELSKRDIEDLIKKLQLIVAAM